MPQDRTPTWRPLSDLPLIAHMIDGMHGDNETLYEMLLQAKDRPHVLDDATVERVERQHTERCDYLDLFAEQLDRWRRQSPSSTQAREIDRLARVLGELKTSNDAILALAAELKEGTIDKILAKDDIELALEFLAGKHKL